MAPMMESRGGTGGVVVCLGVGGMVDLGPLLGLETEGNEEGFGGVEVWLIDSHRPWNLGNVFGGCPAEPPADETAQSLSRGPPGLDGGQIGHLYKPGRGGIVVFDDGDIQEDLGPEREAYLALADMPDVDGDDNLQYSDGDDYDHDSEEDSAVRSGQKRKSWSDDQLDDDLSELEGRPRQRRRSNSVGEPARCIPPRISPADVTIVQSSSLFSATAEAQGLDVYGRG